MLTLDSVIPGQANFHGNKSYTGARFTAIGATSISRLESEFAGEQTGKMYNPLLDFCTPSIKIISIVEYNVVI